MMKHVIEEQPSIEDQLRRRNAELEAEVARLRSVEGEYGRVEAAIIMADPAFDGDSQHASCGERLIASVNRLRDEAGAAAELRVSASRLVDEVAAMGRSLPALFKLMTGHEPADEIESAAGAGPSEMAMIYRNWRGEVGLRRVRAADLRLWHGTTKWHPDPQPLLRAFDLDKAAWRDFALEDCAFLFHDPKAETQTPVGEAGGPADAARAPSCSSARPLRLALEAIAQARPRFDYVAVGAGGVDMFEPGSPYDRGKAAGYQELQAVALGALKYGC